MAALLLSAIAALCADVRADTISMKDGSEVKGIVLEEYKDRLLVSTGDGEVLVMKSLVREMRLDDEDANLVKLGDQARENRRYAKAAEYYNKALKLNSQSKPAKDGLLFIQLYASGIDKSMMAKDIKRQGDIDRDGGSIFTEKSEEEAVRQAQSDIMKYIGIRLCEDGDTPLICMVRSGSPADMAGVKNGDRLVSIWGKFTRYMNIKETADQLLKKSSSELRCTIERAMKVSLNKRNIAGNSIRNSIGASLKIDIDGLVMSDLDDGAAALNAGLKTGDSIISIDGYPTRYMPIKKAIDLINGSSDIISLTIRREISIWKKS